MLAQSSWILTRPKEIDASIVCMCMTLVIMHLNVTFCHSSAVSNRRYAPPEWLVSITLNRQIVVDSRCWTLKQLPAITVALH